MKKCVFAILLIVAVAVGAMFLPQKEIKYDYLRLHIRANSNSKIDQSVKYEIKNEVLEFLTPYFS
ncbi:MAG: stage II sporulation protein R, partial [Clostridia bacterium]|nr:stage II sporulation protein R [Clostridia bacterium]